MKDSKFKKEKVGGKNGVCCVLKFSMLVKINEPHPQGILIYISEMGCDGE